MKVIIIGKGIGWELAPQDGNTWGVNNLCLRRPVELAFNMHDLHKHKDHPLFNKTIDYVNEHKIPIVTQVKYDHIPTSIAFPIKEMPFVYFTNSMDYMVAYAIYKKATEIDIYGVYMALNSEYVVQRPSFEYWIGYARGRGIKVNLCGPTNICSHPKGVYGYEWDDEAEQHVLNRPENKVEVM